MRAKEFLSDSHAHKVVADKLASKNPIKIPTPQERREQIAKREADKKGVKEGTATDLKVGDNVVADTSKEQYPGGHKSRSGKVTRVGQTGVHIQPDDGGEREYHPYKIVKKSNG